MAYGLTVACRPTADGRSPGAKVSSAAITADTTLKRGLATV